jgi:hypothetical protein
MGRDEGSARPSSFSSRRLLEGGRIFALLAAVGGILTCLGATSRWIRVYPSTVGFEGSLLLRPITGPSPTLARGALVGGIAIVVLVGCFIAMSGTSRRRWFAATIVLSALAVALTFHDQRIDDPLSFVPLGIRGGLLPCDPVQPFSPCLTVRPQAEKIEWGGWIAVFWGTLALMRAGSERRARSAEAPPEVSGVIARMRSASDLRILAWMVAGTAVAGIVLYVGFAILYGMLAGDPL